MGPHVTEQNLREALTDLAQTGFRALHTDVPAGMTIPEYGVPVIVGTMHVFDPAWRVGSRTGRSSCTGAQGPFHHRVADERPVRELGDRGDRPPQGGVVPARSDDAGVDPPNLPRPNPRLAVHDLPLVRTFLPDWRRTRGVVSSSTGALWLPRRRSRGRPRLAIDLNHAWARRSLLRSRGGDRRRGAAHPLHALRCSRRISLCDRDRRAGYGPAVRSVLPKRPVRSIQWVRTADS